MHISVTPRVDLDHNAHKTQGSSRSDDPSFERVLESAEDEATQDAERAEEELSAAGADSPEQSSEVREGSEESVDDEEDDDDEEEGRAGTPEATPDVDTSTSHIAVAEAGATAVQAVNAGEDRTPRPKPATASDAAMSDASKTQATGKRANGAAAGSAGDAGSASPTAASAQPQSSQLLAVAPSEMESLLAKAINTNASATASAEAPAAAAAPADQAASLETPAVPATDGSVAKSADRASGVTPRFIDPRALQTAEEARASIFRQIAMRLTPEGGEMRMRLDPPELGQLNLHMVVDKAGSMRLQIVAERPEIASVIERHLGELKQTLAEQGIDVAQADIQFSERGQAHEQLADEWGQASHETNTGEGAEHEEAPAARNLGYITAEGLDYWV